MPSRTGELEVLVGTKESPGEETRRQMPVQATLPASLAKPDRLSSELVTMVGMGKFKVQMFHDVYMIMTTERLEIVG